MGIRTRIIIALAISLLTSRVGAKMFLGLNAGKGSKTDAAYSTFIGGFSMGYERHGIGGEVQLLHQTQATRYAEGMREGTLTTIPIMANFRVSGPIARHWRVIAKGGLHYMMADRELSERQIWLESYPNYKVSEEIKPTYGGQFGGGIEYRISKMAISLEVIQLFNHSTIKHTKKDLNDMRDRMVVSEDGIDLGQIIGIIGVKVYW